MMMMMIFFFFFFFFFFRIVIIGRGISHLVLPVGSAVWSSAVRRGEWWIRVWCGIADQTNRDILIGWSHYFDCDHAGAKLHSCTHCRCKTTERSAGCSRASRFGLQFRWTGYFFIIVIIIVFCHSLHELWRFEFSTVVKQQQRRRRRWRVLVQRVGDESINKFFFLVWFRFEFEFDNRVFVSPRFFRCFHL